MADLARQAYDMGIQNGIPQHQMQSIMDKASRGEAMQTPTPQKQAVYDAYQNYYKAEIQQKAQAGQALAKPNDWKNSLYNQAVQSSAQQTAQQPLQGSQGLMDINSFLQQSQTSSDAKLASLEQYLQSSAQAQIQSQQAQLGLGRDQQLAEIDRALNEAVNQGQLSIKDAQKQFENAKQQIHQQAYVDSEHTNLVAHDRGIQNSAQMIGLMQGDQSRTNSLLNQNLTTRDEQVNAINNQLAQMEYNANIDKSLANSQYNYGLAGAQGEIYGDMYNNIANLSYEEFARLQGQQSQFQQLGLQQQFGRENMSLEQMYQMQQMAQNQNYTGQNMQTQQGFDMQKLSAQQKYTLEQMAKAQGYDLDKLSAQQQYTLAQMAKSFGYDMSMQGSQQAWQGQQNQYDRDFERELQEMRQDHDLSMLTEEQKAQLDTYDTELARKLRSVTPGTDEYKILEGEANFAYAQMTRENQGNFAAEIGATELAALLAQYPTEMPDPTNKDAVDKYNSNIERLNKQVQKLVGTESAEQYIRDLAKSKGKSEQESGGFLNWVKGIVKAVPAVWLGNKLGESLKP